MKLAAQVTNLKIRSRYAIRMALVAEVDECIEAAKRIRTLIESL